jgi:acetoin utilization protein AcuB
MKNEPSELITVIEEMCAEQSISFKPMRVAQDIMNPDVKTLTLDHTVNQCLQFMKGRHVRHVPVIDLPYEGETKPCFIGVVSERDVLRLNTPDPEKDGKQKIDQRALRQLLIQIVTRKPKFVSPETSVQEAIRIMTSNHIDMVPVLDGSDLVGIITTSDLIKLLFKLEAAINKLRPKLNTDTSEVGTGSETPSNVKIMSSWAFRTVQDIMTKEVICLEPQDNLIRAIEIIQSEEFRHIPINNEQGKFVGLVSDRDILRNLPYAGKKPASAPNRFREHLFATDSWTTNFLMPLEKIMIRNVKYISSSCKILEAADILSKKKISCLPVIDDSEKLEGIVTITDLMQVLLDAYEPAGKAGLTPSESCTC